MSANATTLASLLSSIGDASYPMANSLELETMLSEMSITEQPQGPTSAAEQELVEWEIHVTNAHYFLSTGYSVFKV